MKVLAQSIVNRVNYAQSLVRYLIRMKENKGPNVKYLVYRIIVDSTVNNVFPLNTSLNIQLDKYTVSIKQAVKNFGLSRNNNHEIESRLLDDVIDINSVSSGG